MKKNNIVLIGMPGCGKSTTGVVLAKAMGYDFLDSDILIQHEKGATLEKLIEQHGPDGFNIIEDEVNSKINVEKTVIATGGSVVYGENAMANLKKIGVVVFIKLECDAVARRLGDLKARGISMKEGQTLEDLFDERQPLYEKYADIIVDTSGMQIREAMAEIKNLVEEYNVV